MEHKDLRYAKIAKIFQDDSDFSVHDVGAGVGHFYQYLKKHINHKRFTYSISEITKEYCDIAKQQYPEIEIQHRDILNEDVNETFDYVVLSGVFHQKGNAKHKEWIEYIEQLLAKSYAISKKGIAFNVLSPYADYYNPENFYGNLFEIQSFIVKRMSRFFKMDHSYPLFECTFYIYKKDFISKSYNSQNFQKYIK